MARYPAKWILPFTMGVVLSLDGLAIRAQDYSEDEQPAAIAEEPTLANEPEVVERADRVAPSEEPTAAPSESYGTESNEAQLKSIEAEPAPLDDSTTVTPSKDGESELIQERYPNRAIKVEREVSQDANGNYVNHGPWKMFDQQGNVIAEGEYLKGQRHGNWTRWYRGGEADLFSKAPYNQFTGPYISQASFENGKLQGKWTIYDGKQRKISEWEFANDLRSGKSVWWYANGRKMRDIDYREGEIDGNLMEWSADYKIITKATYQMGRKIAPKTEFHQANSQQKKSEGMYLHAKEVVQTGDDWWNAKVVTYSKQGKDEKHGMWTSWFASGQKQLQGEYQNDAQVGKFTWWYANGQKALEGHYDMGKQNGRWTWWHENGQKKIQGDYVKGNPMGRWTWWHDDGKVVQAADLSHSEGVVIESHKADKNETSSLPVPHAPKVKFKR